MVELVAVSVVVLLVELVGFGRVLTGWFLPFIRHRSGARLWVAWGRWGERFRAWLTWRPGGAALLVAQVAVAGAARSKVRV